MQKPLGAEDDTDAHSPAGVPDGLPIPRRYWAVVAIWLAMAMSVLDGAIANLALPTLAGELHATARSSLWVVTPYLFAINVPIGLLAIAIGFRSLPATVGCPRKFDWVSALLNAATFGFLITGAESVASAGLASGLTKLAIGAAAGALLTYRELRRENPLVPFDLLRIPIFGLSILTSIFSFTAQMMAYVGLPFYFQSVMGRTAVETGLLMTPWPIAVGVSAPIAGRLADRYRAGALGGIGLTVFAAGLGLLSAIQPGASNLDIA